MDQKLFALDRKVAVVTGAQGLLGQQFCIALVNHGARVAALDLAVNASRPLKSFVEAQERGLLRTFKADITSRAELERALDEIRKALGSPEVLVNNAAIDSPPSSPVAENGPFETYPESSLDKMLAVNVKGTVLACQVFGGAMAEAGRGSIINVASIYGLVSPDQSIYAYKRKRGEDWYKPVGYAVTKSAILNLTRYLAAYWAKKGVRVNTLSPAGIFNNQDQEFLSEYTNRIPIGRMAHPHEMNGAVVFLASDASSYMTGSNLVVDGGWTAI